jgi:hypothetical protein
MKKKIIAFVVLLAVCASVVGGFLLWNGVQEPGEYSSERHRLFFESIQHIPDADRTAVTVNGEKITIGQIQTQVLTNQFGVESYKLDCAAKNETPDPEIITGMTRTEQEITDQLIRNLVIRQEAERLKLTASRKEGKQRAEAALAEVQRLAVAGDAEAKESLARMADEMLSKGKTMAQWADTMAESYQNNITAGNLEAHYKKNTTDTILDYESYVQNLIAKADIRYMK